MLPILESLQKKVNIILFYSMYVYNSYFDIITFYIITQTATAPSAIELPEVTSLHAGVIAEEGKYFFFLPICMYTICSHNKQHFTLYNKQLQYHWSLKYLKLHLHLLESLQKQVNIF